MKTSLTSNEPHMWDRLRSRWATLAMMFAIAVAPIAAVAQPAVEEAPATESSTETDLETVAVAALTSYDNLMTDLGFVGELAGRPEIANMAEGMIAMFTQGRGIVGLDKSQPIGVMLQTDGVTFVPIVALPINDLSALLELVKGMGITPFEAGDGITEIELPDQTIYLKEGKNWTFAAQSAEALDSAPADPSDQLKEIAADYDLGVRLMVQNVPDMYRDMALEQLQEGMEEGLEREDGETDEEYEQRRDLATGQVEQIADLIQGIDELTFGVQIGSHIKSAYFDLSMTGVEGTDLGEAMNGYNDVTTDLAGFHNADAAMSILGAVNNSPKMIEKQRDQLELTFETLQNQMERAIEEEMEDLSTTWKEALKSAGADLLAAYKDLAFAEKSDMGGNITAGEGSCNGVFATTHKSPENLINALKKIEAAQAADPLPGDAFPSFKWDADKHGEVALHHIVLVLPDEAELDDLRKVIGDQLEFTLGVGPEHVYAAFGDSRDEKLKKAIDDSASKAGTKLDPAMEMFIAAKQIYAFVEHFLDEEDLAEFEEKTLGVAEIDAEKDHLKITVGGIENGFRIRYEAEEWILRAIGKIASTAAEAQMQGF